MTFATELKSSFIVLQTEERTEINNATFILTTYLEETELKIVQDQKEALERITKAVFSRSGGICFWILLIIRNFQEFLAHRFLVKVLHVDTKLFTGSHAASNMAPRLQTTHFTFRLHLLT